VTGSRWFLVAVTVLAVGLMLPSLGGGLSGDDYAVFGILSGSAPLTQAYTSRLDVFNFFDGTPERTGRLLDLGILPWWTLPDLRLAFWRPVTALTHWLDYAGWGHRPALMHVHSLFWFAVLVVAAGMDGVLPGVVAGLVDLPVIGLPVGIGYGVGGRGVAALLTMLQSCSTGLVVVNVDNGIGAGAAAVLIAGRSSVAGSHRSRPARSQRGSPGQAR